MNNSITVGIDIGGTHISAGLVDLESRTILPNSLFRSRLNTQASVEEILTVWSEVIKKAAAFGTGNLRLGMAMPGPFEYEKGISLMTGQNKYDAFYDLNIKQLLALKLGIKKEDILMMNDAGCFLKGEVYGGAAQNYSNVIGLTLGTGLGSAKFNLPFTYDAELWCHPFFDSIAEDYLSSRWFVNRFSNLSGIEVKDVKELSSYVETNASAKIVFEEFGTNLGLFLLEFINMENPEVVILGGNISKAYNLFIKNTLTVLDRHSIKIPIVKATLGEDAAIIGAASLWANKRE